MPKRKHQDNDYDYLCKKLKKIEKKLRRDKDITYRRRVRVISDSSDSSGGLLQDRDTTTSNTIMPQRADELVTQQAPPSPSVPAEPAAPDLAERTPLVPEVPIVDLVTETIASGSQEDIIPELDADVLEILGIDPTSVTQYGKNIQKDLAVRFEHSVTEGLSKESRKELVEQYLVPSNCKLVGAPVLNPELKAALTEQVVRRDKAIESKQKVTSAAISSLGQAITHILSSKNKDTERLRLLMDTGRLLCDCQHSDTQTRRNYVISSIKKEMKESLQNSKVDSFLFGQSLPDTLKAAKAINKSGAELKINSAPKPGPSKKFTSTNPKNWKSNAPRKPATAPKETTLLTTPAPTKTPRAGYLRPLQDQRTPRSRRY